MNKKFYSSVWRWHFFAGLYVVPFLLMLAITGLLMLASPWTDAWQFGEKLTTVTVSANGQQRLPAQEQLEKVQAAYPAGQVVEFVPPSQVDQSSLFKVRGVEASTLLVFVNPYTGEVLGDFANADRLYAIGEEIHGTLLLGKTGDALIELAAGFGFLLVITGLYLHWPRNGTALRRLFIPGFLQRSGWSRALGQGKRAGWKSIHSSVGFYLSLFLLFFLLTGMAWTGIWGQKLVQPWNSFPVEKRAGSWSSAPGLEREDEAQIHADLNTDTLNEVPWNLELSPVPLSKPL